MRLNWSTGKSVLYRRAEGELDIDNQIDTDCVKVNPE